MEITETELALGGAAFLLLGVICFSSFIWQVRTEPGEDFVKELRDRFGYGPVWVNTFLVVNKIRLIGLAIFGFICILGGILILIFALEEFSSLDRVSQHITN